MGIKGLDKFIRNNTNYTITHTNLSYINNKSVIIDTSCLVYRYILYNESKFMTIFKNILRKFEKYNIKPIFVFDGCSPVEKSKIITKRKEKKRDAIQELNDLNKDKLIISSVNVNEELISTISDKYITLNNTNLTIGEIINEKINKVQKKSIHFKYNHITQMKEYLTSKNINYIHANIEADLICAIAVKYGFANYCISDDTDMFPYNCDHVIRNINFRNETIDIYNRHKLLNELDITNEQFIDLCILLGSDYIPRTIGIKLTNILLLIKKYNSIENIIINIDKINKEEFITKTIYMNQLNKYINIRKLFNYTYNQEIINEVLININSFLRSA
jgi:flap endonuclease-1